MISVGQDLGHPRPPAVGTGSDANPIQRLLVKSADFAEPFMVPVAFIAVACHPIFYLIWAYAFPQPYENLALRLLGSAVWIPIVFKDQWPDRLKPWLPLYWHFVVMFSIPFFFSLYTLLNAYSPIWVLTVISGAFLMTFFVHWVLSITMFVLGTGAAFALFAAFAQAELPAAPQVEIFIVYLFVLGFGSVINLKLQDYRKAEATLERKLRAMSGQNAALMRERNKLLGHFLNNTVIARLNRFEHELGLDAALARITRRERCYCAMMQADIRRFTRMFSGENELEVAQLVAQCFSEITAIGQDLSVIKPVGDCIFLYSDIEQGREDAVLNVLALACVFVQSVERINRTVVAAGGAPLNFGVAVHSGHVIYGNLASETLIDPTVIGVNVNRTARMEELTKWPAVLERVGVNAIILSEEFSWQVRKAGRSLPGLVTLDLAEIGASIRDFPEVHRVCALPKAAALDLSIAARERIRSARLARPPRLRQTDYSRHKEVEYCYEMYGSGPAIVWSMFVNVSRYPVERVKAIVHAHLAHLKFTISSGDEHWLALSTENDPGAYDETDIEAWVIELIDRLTDPSENDLRRSGRMTRPDRLRRQP